MAGLSIAYLITHPLTVLILWPSLLARLLDLAIALLIVLVAGTMGTSLTRKLGAPRYVRLVLRLALGLGLIGLLVLVVGSTFGLSKITYWFFIVVGLLILRNDARIWLSDLSSASKIWQESSGIDKIFVGLALVIFGFTLIIALAPPLKFDALVYHLTMPALYQETGRIFYIEEITHWGFPQLAQMLSTLGLTLGASRVAPIGWALGIFSLLGLSAYVTDRIGKNAALIALSAILAGSSLAASLAWSYVDWPLILFSWALLACLDYFLESKEKIYLVLGAVFTAFAFSTKYTAALLFPLGGLTLLIHHRKNRKVLVLFSLIALALVAPWLARNYLATTNPIYPLLFSGGAIDSLRLQSIQALPPQGNWLDLVFLPIRATLWGVEGGRIGNAPGYEASIGPLLLVFSIFAWTAKNQLSEKQARLLSIATLFGLGTLIVWAILARFSGHLSRTHLYYFAFPAFAILAAYGYSALSKITDGRLPILLAITFLTLSVFNIVSTTFSTQAFLPLFDESHEQAYLEKNLGLHAIVMQTIREELAFDARVLMLWEARAFYCAPKCDPDELLDRWNYELSFEAGPAALIDKWKSMGYSHILYYREAAQFIANDPGHYLPLDLRQIEDELSKLPVLIDFNQSYTLYDLSYD